MCMTGVAEEERENGAEGMFKVTMAKTFSKLTANSKPQIQEVQRTPSKIQIKNLHLYIVF